MTNKKIWLGMLVMVLAFGMTVVGCEEEDEDSGDTNYLDTFNFSNSSPTSAALSAGGLTQTQFTQIRDAAGGGFLGWALDDDGYGGQNLMMVWTGRSVSNFTTVATLLNSLFTQKYTDNDSDSRGVSGDNYSLDIYTNEVRGGGFYMSAGTMMAQFSK